MGDNETRDVWIRSQGGGIERKRRWVWWKREGMHRWVVGCQTDVADTAAHKRQRGHGLCRNDGLTSSQLGLWSTSGNLGCVPVRV